LEYTIGQGCARDPKKAMEFLLKATDQGCAEAQCHLGAMYFFGGGGVDKDLKKALLFLNAAEAQGYELAHAYRKQVEAILHHPSNDCSTLNAPPPGQCACCGCSAGNDVKLKPCPRCKGPLYCGKDCQQAHWKGGHKERCTRK